MDENSIPLPTILDAIADLCSFFFAEDFKYVFQRLRKKKKFNARLPRREKRKVQLRK